MPEETDRALALSAWLKRNASRPMLNTVVSDPKPSSTPSSFLPITVTLFTISTRSPLGEDWVVDRSIADFSVLRTSLLSRYPGSVLPQLPAELAHLVDGLKKTKEARKVKQGDILNHFLRFVSRHPFLSQDEVLYVFLSHANVNPVKFQEVAKGMLSPNPTGLSSSSIFSKLFNRRGSKPQLLSNPSSSSSLAAGVGDFTATEWWKEAVELAVEPVDAMLVCKQVLGELERIKKRMSELKVTVRDFRDKTRLTGEACFAVQKTLGLCSEGGEAGGMVALYKAQEAKFNTQAQLHQEMALESSSTILSGIREELLLLEAYKDQVLLVRDSIAKEDEVRLLAQKRERELAIVEQEFATERNNNFAFEDKEEPKKLRVARKAKDEALFALSTAVQLASVLTRATLTLEINLFREERVLRTEQYFAEFATVYFNYSTNSAAVWSKQPLQDERLVTWNEEIPWDSEVPRFVQVVFDFTPENADEVEARAGDRGTAVPIDQDREWVQLTLPNGTGGLIPTSFVRLIGVVAPAQAPLPASPSLATPITAALCTDSNHEAERLEQELKVKALQCESQHQDLIESRQRCEQLLGEMAELRRAAEVAKSERDEAVAKLASGNIGSKVLAKDSSKEEGELPPNWIKGFDPVRQKAFYHNTETLVSVWKFPKPSAPKRTQEE
ncbi:hypothetical protein BASA81_000449 [Batrachochytrium salamandrivorans]|nr:hypothetical protein BASA81_000449 [Batrachochytrium salamandrivorans]